MMKVLVAAMSLPVDESTALIESVTKEVKQRKPADGKTETDHAHWRSD